MLTSPVNTFISHIEYMLRFIYLYVYFVDELPPDLTMRSFIQFLRQRLLVEKEEIPYLVLNNVPGSFRKLEFSGFVHGLQTHYVRFSKELDEEVRRIVEISYPPDEEIKEHMHEMPLSEAVKYSGILPSDVEREEEFLTKAQWEEKKREEKKEREEKKRKVLARAVSRSGVLKTGEEKVKKRKIRKLKGMKT